jgi:hypothetical protein
MVLLSIQHFILGLNIGLPNIAIKEAMHEIVAIKILFTLN